MIFGMLKMNQKIEHLLNQINRYQIKFIFIIIKIYNNSFIILKFNKKLNILYKCKNN